MKSWKFYRFLVIYRRLILKICNYTAFNNLLHIGKKSNRKFLKRSYTTYIGYLGWIFAWPRQSFDLRNLCLNMNDSNKIDSALFIQLLNCLRQDQGVTVHYKNIPACSKGFILLHVFYQATFESDWRQQNEQYKMNLTESVYKIKFFEELYTQCLIFKD